MALLFEVSIDNISLHIKNILRENELDISSIEESSVVQIEGNRKVNRRIKIYNLDMIISVGYRVKSQRGILFRKWANKILKEYLIQGYSINQKRISALNKTIEIQNKMLASSLNIEQEALVNVIEEYTSVFGVEKEEGKLNGILAAVYQNVFGQEVYPSLEEKAAHLLYFLVKDHPFADGCKRIAATLFLEFLNKNHALIKGGKKIIANDTLVAITVLTAESRPEEKDVMIKLIMNFLDKGK